MGDFGLQRVREYSISRVGGLCVSLVSLVETSLALRMMAMKGSGSAMEREAFSM